MPLATIRRSLRSVVAGDGAPSCAFCCVVMSLLGLGIISPLAAATLPDPLWISGISDGGDYDDLIALSTDGGSPRASPPVLPEGILDLRPFHARVCSRGRRVEASENVCQQPASVRVGLRIRPPPPPSLPTRAFLGLCIPSLVLDSAPAVSGAKREWTQ